jgi:lipid-binding SYLF domain-containing protein
MSRLVTTSLSAAAVLLSLSCSRLGAEGLTTDEIVRIARDLGERIEMPEEKIDDLIHNFKEAVQEGPYEKALASKPAAAVLVYRRTEAGLLYKRSSGYGLVKLAGEDEPVEVTLKSSSIGAQIGGSAEWGIGVVMGLRDRTDFGGRYAGEEKSATAADQTTPWGAFITNAAYVERLKAHDIFVVVTGRGLSAGVSDAQFTITPKW